MLFQSGLRATVVRTTHAVNRFGGWLVFFRVYLKTSKIPSTPAEDWESLVLNVYTLYFIGSKWNILEDFPHPRGYVQVKKMFFCRRRPRPRLRRVTMWHKVVALSVVRDIWFIFACETFIFFPWQWNKEIICLWKRKKYKTHIFQKR